MLTAGVFVHCAFLKFKGCCLGFPCNTKSLKSRCTMDKRKMGRKCIYVVNWNRPRAITWIRITLILSQTCQNIYEVCACDVHYTFHLCTSSCVCHCSCVCFCSHGEVGGSISEHLEARLKDFVKNDSEVVLTFPTSLSSYHRRIVHEVCTIIVFKILGVCSNIKCVALCDVWICSRGAN